MLTKKQLDEIDEKLNKAQNPLFFFDNDQDGLCSFLILQRTYGKGKGFPIKSPELDKSYFRKVRELNPDYIFILDMPKVSDEFFEEVGQYNIPVVWIDHHLVEKEDFVPEFAEYYNPMYNKKQSHEPVTHLCYSLKKRKEDLWLAIVGCVADMYLPEYYEEFRKDYPELVPREKNVQPSDIFYNSEIGKVARIFAYGLKDTTTNVIGMMKFLRDAKTPYDVLNETSRNKSLHKRYTELNKKYEKFLNNARENVEEKDKLVFFEYSGEMSMSSEIANGLSYLFPNKYILVVYSGGEKANISGRGKDIKEITLKVLENFEDSNGGGHDNAIGARIKKEDIPEFKKSFESFLENR